MTRRTFSRICTVAFGAAATPPLMTGEIAARTMAASAAGVGAGPRVGPSTAQDTDAGQLRSEFLLDLVFDRGPANNVGSQGVSLTVVPVAGGTFEGSGLKGKIVGPSGDWIVSRPDGSSLLDMRMVLQTDDDQKIALTWRGIAYVQQGGDLFARILPMFETGAEKYSWLNKIVSVGVYRPVAGKVGYRVYKIL